MYSFLSQVLEQLLPSSSHALPKIVSAPFPSPSLTFVLIWCNKQPLSRQPQQQEILCSKVSCSAFRMLLWCAGGQLSLSLVLGYWLEHHLAQDICEVLQLLCLNIANSLPLWVRFDPVCSFMHVEPILERHQALTEINSITLIGLLNWREKSTSPNQIRSCYCISDFRTGVKMLPIVSESRFLSVV